MWEIGPEIGSECCFVRLQYIYALVLVLQLKLKLINSHVFTCVFQDTTLVHCSQKWICLVTSVT